MKRSREKELRFKGEMTIFFSLVFALVLALVGVLVGSVSVQMEKSEKRIDTLMALESTFAEYDRNLFENFHVFARNGADEKTISNRLHAYGADGLHHTMEASQLLTDDHARAFYLQAVAYEKIKYGLEGGIGKENDFSGDKDYEKDLDDFLFLESFDFGESENPLKPLQNLKNKSLLSLAKPKDMEVSEKKAETTKLATQRTLRAGEGELDDGKNITSSDRIFFLQYLVRHFGNALKSKGGDVLSYELEYLLAGGEADQQNLETVLGKIATLRMITNYSYLMTDEARKSEAEALALVICSLMLQPASTEVVKQGLLLAWAYAESVLDLRVLLKGECVSPVKSDATWQLQLENLMKIGTEEDREEGNGEKKGLSYENYLQGFLLLESREKLAMRGIDLIEMRLNIEADTFLTGVWMQSHMTLRYGIQETFSTRRTYQS